MTDTNLKNALKIGSICISAYLVNYLLRNILSVLTPQMLATGDYTKEHAALLSSTYLIVYASGQLVNGIIGDIVKPRIMVCVGLLLGGIPLLLFPLCRLPFLQILCFGCMGFGLSMLRGPLVKVISENTAEKYARICCVLLSFASFTGPLLAGVLAMLLPWETVFYTAGALSVVMSCVGSTALYILEKKQLISPCRTSASPKKHGWQDIAAIFRLEQFTVYIGLCMVVEISAASISFWIPTYISEALAFPANVSGMLYSVIAFVRALAPFLAVLLFSLFRLQAMKLMRCMFLLSTACFAVMLMLRQPWLQIVLLILALTAASCASSAIWSIYIPSLGKSGKVSGANGILDCSGYIAASVTNMIFAGVMSRFGWTGLLIAWGISMLSGAVITLFGRESHI